MDIMDFKDPDFKEAATTGQWEPYFSKWLTPKDAPKTEDDDLLLAAYEHAKKIRLSAGEVSDSAYQHTGQGGEQRRQATGQI